MINPLSKTLDRSVHTKPNVAATPRTKKNEKIKNKAKKNTYDELPTLLKGVVDKQKLSDQEKHDAFLTAKKRGVPAIQH